MKMHGFSVSLKREVSGPGSVATWVKLESNGIANLDSLTGDSGDIVIPDINSNINIVSNVSGLSFVGTVANNSLTLTSTGSGADVIETITGNTGGPIEPLSGNINVIGDNIGVTVVGNPLTNTLEISLVGGGDAAEDFPTDAGIASSILGVLNINAGNSTQHAGSSVSFSAPGPSNTVQLNVTDINQNIIIGESAGNATISGTNNTILGLASGSDLTSGGVNTFVGTNVGELLTTGDHNTLLGYQAGENYTSSESSNVLINSGGILGESHVLRVGRATGIGVGYLNKSFIQGIVGVTPDTADGIPVFIGSDGQLGTVGAGGSTFIQTLTGDGSVVVSPLAGNINIIGDGATAAVTANPGTHTLTISAIGGGGGTLNDLVGDDSVVVVPAAGMINVIANQAAQMDVDLQ